MNLSFLDIAIIVTPLILMGVLTVWMKRYLRSVTDFLAASRTAGRYLMCTAGAEMSAGVLGTVVALEIFSKSGMSLLFWGNATSLVAIFVTITGFVTYRFRETRALTFHQFLEARYSKSLRIFASILTFVSGMFYFGVIPGVCARFFVYFLELPEHVQMFGWMVPTFVLVMFVVLALSMFFTLTSGQIGVMVTDSIEYVVSMLLYIVIAVAVLGLVAQPLVTFDQMESVMTSGAKGLSYIDPLDVNSRVDFNVYFVLFGLMLTYYQFRGNSNASVSAANAHEARMAGIIGGWRMIGAASLSTLLAVAAFTVLKHPDFAVQQVAVQERLANIPPQLQTQMTMPTALGILLPPGVRGCLAAIALLGSLASFGTVYMQMGGALLQDVVLPIRNKPLAPKTHIKWLRWSLLGFSLWTVFFSALFKPADYLTMLMQLFSSIYLGGAGAVILGGLYWKRGTTQGAYTALIMGAVLSVSGLSLQSSWGYLHPHLLRLSESGGYYDWLLLHGDKFPLNGQLISVLVVVLSITGYVVVSLMTGRAPHNMDKLLHRGEYKINDVEAEVVRPTRRSWLARVLNIDEHYSRGDKSITYVLFGYTLLWSVSALGVLGWNLWVQRWPASYWWIYTYTQFIAAAFVAFLITFFWLTWGASRDIVSLIRRLEAVRHDANDDGQVLVATDKSTGPVK